MLFIVTKHWKQSKCPTVSEWISRGASTPQNITQQENEQTTDMHNNLDESQGIMLSEKN